MVSRSIDLDVCDNLLLAYSVRDVCNVTPHRSACWYAGTYYTPLLTTTRLEARSKAIESIIHSSTVPTCNCEHNNNSNQNNCLQTINRVNHLIKKLEIAPDMNSGGHYTHTWQKAILFVQPHQTTDKNRPLHTVVMITTSPN